GRGLARIRPGLAGRRSGDSRRPGEWQAQGYADRPARSPQGGGGSARFGVGQGAAPTGRRNTAQGDCGSRQAGEYRGMMRRFLPLLGLTLVPLLASCGLHPLYGGGSSGTVAMTLRTVEVGPIEGQVGWLVRNNLVDRLGESGSASPLYRLDVKLDDNITGFGIRGDRAVTR